MAQSGIRLPKQLEAAYREELSQVQVEIDALTSDDDEQRYKIRDLKHKIWDMEEIHSAISKYVAVLLRFIAALRESKAGAWGYDNIVNHLFDPQSRCIINHNAPEASMPLTWKRALVRAVLEETDLTEEEARALVEQQCQKNRKENDEQQERRGPSDTPPPAPQ